MDGKTLVLSALKKKRLKEPFFSNLVEFMDNYLLAAKDIGLALEPLLPRLNSYIQLVWQNVKNPFSFPPYHKVVLEPFNHYQFSIDFWFPLINAASSVFHGKENADLAASYLEKGENVIFLSNHQSEADPKVLAVHFGKYYPKVAKEMIYVAGHRVTTDPVSVPFSMGANLLCIYSKKRIAHNPELKEKRILHNRRAMQVLQTLLKEGGRSIYVAPSGGRDRPDSSGFIDVSPFDPASIEMFRLIALQAKTPTHFFPLSLHSYDLMPPPDTLETGLVEKRVPKHAPVHLYIGEELDFHSIPQKYTGDKTQERLYRCNLAYQAVRNNYIKLLKLVK